MVTAKKGIPFVISGPSGSGKGTIVKEILKQAPERFALSVSATTRAPRPGERNGVDYYFISREEFERRIAAGEILEYTSYCGNYYGTPKSEVERLTAAGVNVILEIEIEGGMNARRLLPGTVLMFVLPPDAETLESRLRGRGTNTEEEISNRLAKARIEIRSAYDYDYIIINEDNAADRAASEIISILDAEAHRTSRSTAAVDAFFAES